MPGEHQRTTGAVGRGAPGVELLTSDSHQRRDGAARHRRDPPPGIEGGVQGPSPSPLSGLCLSLQGRCLDPHFGGPCWGQRRRPSGGRTSQGLLHLDGAVVRGSPHDEGQWHLSPALEDARLRSLRARPTPELRHATRRQRRNSRLTTLLKLFRLPSCGPVERPRLAALQPHDAATPATSRGGRWCETDGPVVRGTNQLLEGRRGAAPWADPLPWDPSSRRLRTRLECATFVADRRVPQPNDGRGRSIDHRHGVRRCAPGVGPSVRPRRGGTR